MSKPAAVSTHANRMLAMLGGILRIAIRADSPDMLYRETCRIAVECGPFRFAWIGLVDPAGEGLRMLAHAGEACDDVLAIANGIAASVRDNARACVRKDLSEEACLRSGITSMAGLPLLEDGRLAGVFMLYATHGDCFDDATVALLREIVHDISFSLEHMTGEQRRLAAESKLHYMAFYDAQTGLPNRALMDERLQALAESGASLALLDIRVLRLDRALHLFGRLAMDDVLRLLASRLEALRGGDGFLAQLAQDEFALVLPEQGEGDETESMALRVLAAMEEPIRLDEREVFLGASVGAAIYPVHDDDIGHLLHRARAAADHHGGEGGFRMYSEDLDRGLEQRARTEAELHRALERGELQLFYQPQLSLRTGSIVGVEALLQWQHPQRGLLGPGHFVHLLEECGLMPAVGGWALRQACRQTKEWQEMGLPPLRMGVNLSALQFRLADLVSIVRGALHDAGLAPEYLELELTESLILENVEQTIRAMHELKRLGVSLSLDDFGTGYSSLSYLRRYPVDRIKIDQSFVRDMVAHAGSAALVRSILAMAHNLGLETIAEGVETTEQFEYLRKQPCDEMQGFLFSRAVPASKIARMLTEGHRLQSEQAIASRGVLVVDENAAVLDGVRQALVQDGWNVLCASDAADASSLLAANRLAVLVSGLQDGAFLQRIRQTYPDTVRILLAGDADIGAVIEAVNHAEVYRVVAKPVDAKALQACVRDAYRHYGMQPMQTMRAK